MRLTHIKLAGFKTFVDPTHIALPGQLVGVVGPNGCGKSNVIDAVRWVLGESSARHLRGETMQDVIFSGSSERKPVNRASVELVFDNSLGRAAGPWSAYGEISIRRVLERQGESSYYINNLAVRRRDVADIFLGTGLGARAYAIVEQGMVSRIVEAKPEELRVFLEEAAGVSRYRERRRETENRLDDARENLTRVEDIRGELGAQTARLEEQAVAAERYRTLEADIRRGQHLLWALRQRDAASLRERLAGEGDQVTLDLERSTARLRETEAALEGARSIHYAAVDAVHAAQGGLYEANAELSRLEQQLQFQRAARGRAHARQAELQSQLAADDARRADLEAALAEGQVGQEAATEMAAECEARLEAVREALPEAEETARRARAAQESAREAVGRARRDREVAATRRDQSDRLQGQLRARAARLSDELAAIGAPDEAEVARLREACLVLEEALAEAREAQAEAGQRLPGLEDAVRLAVRDAEARRRELGELEARRQALDALQQKVGGGSQLSGWLARQGLSQAVRLWQTLRVAAGWEDAVESVLRERLNALALDDDTRLEGWLSAPPPAKLAFILRTTGSPATGSPAPDGCRSLASLVAVEEAATAAAVAGWFARVWAADDAATARRVAVSLPPGEVVVTPQGHQFGPGAVVLHAPDSEVHGLLERKREIEALEARIPEALATLDGARTAVSDAEAALAGCRASLEDTRRRVAALSQQRHEAEIAHVRLAQQAERARERRDQVARELADLQAEQGREAEVGMEAALQAEAATEVSQALEDEAARADAAFQRAERELGYAREAVTTAERHWREAQFDVRAREARLEDMARNLEGLDQSLGRARTALAQVLDELQSHDEGPLEESLGASLALRQTREQALAACRDALSEAEAVLRGLDETRVTLERSLEPLRQRQGELRLREQEARLAEEGFAAQLAEAGADGPALLAAVDKAPRPGALQAEIARHQEELASLGAVNLAALDELRKTTERKAFLDAQATDLDEAVRTLEDAIRRIDRETRDRLMATFDQVNGYLGDFFPRLFGGGEARLVLTGEEILDSGLQIEARPPGKAKAPISRLSGGEKALTAVALVFSLFRLNPAPFCLLDEVDAPLDDSNVGRFCQMVRSMSDQTQFVFISHNKVTMEMADQLIGVTMAERGVSRVVAVDMEEALRMGNEKAA